MKTDQNKMLAVLGMMLFLANGDNYAAASLLSDIAADLHLALSTAAWSVIAYMLSFGAFTLVFGPLSDRFGKVRVVLAASLGTAIFSILGAGAFNLPSLVFFRAMNGLFGAGIFPVAFALIGETFDNEHRQPAIGKAMGMAFLGAATATAIGGALGTALNAALIKVHGVEIIFHNASFVFLTASLLAAVFVSRFEMRKRMAIRCCTN